MLGPYELDQIYTGESGAMLAALPANCIDLTVTSPPYDPVTEDDNGNLITHPGGGGGGGNTRIERVMDWKPEMIKPTPYEVVLLQLSGDTKYYTTGWWADKADEGRGEWIGLALNQSPPVYVLEDKAVKHWCEITSPEAVEKPK